MGKTHKECLIEILCSPVCDNLTGAQKQALDAVTELLGFCDYEELCALVKAYNDSKLMVLPCNVGDYVWVTTANKGKVEQPIKGHVQEFILHDDEVFEAIVRIGLGDGEKEYGYAENSFGKIVFFDFESAKAALQA